MGYSEAPLTDFLRAVSWPNREAFFAEVVFTRRTFARYLGPLKGGGPRTFLVVGPGNYHEVRALEDEWQADAKICCLDWSGAFALLEDVVESKRLGSDTIASLLLADYTQEFEPIETFMDQQGIDTIVIRQPRVSDDTVDGLSSFAHFSKDQGLAMLVTLGMYENNNAFVQKMLELGFTYHFDPKNFGDSHMYMLNIPFDAEKMPQVDISQLMNCYQV